MPNPSQTVAPRGQTMSEGNAYAEGYDRALSDLAQVMRPFHEATVEMFCRNWNREDLVLALDNPEEACRLTFGDFLDMHALLLSAKRKKEAQSDV